MSLNYFQVHTSGPGLSETDKAKFNKEYEQYKEKLEKQREEYLKAHPDVARQHELEAESAADTEFDYSVKELRQIFLGQSEVFDQVKMMHRKLDEIIGRQERALSLITSIQSGTQPLANAGQGKLERERFICTLYRILRIESSEIELSKLILYLSPLTQFTAVEVAHQCQSQGKKWNRFLVCNGRYCRTHVTSNHLYSSKVVALRCHKVKLTRDLKTRTINKLLYYNNC